MKLSGKFINGAGDDHLQQCAVSDFSLISTHPTAIKLYIARQHGVLDDVLKYVSLPFLKASVKIETLDLLWASCGPPASECISEGRGEPLCAL